MPQSFISVFVDDAAATALTTRVPDAIVNSGLFGGASNSPGIGISTENPDLQEALFEATDGSGDLVTGSWTLLDQFGDVRAQIGQLIGGTGITDVADYPSSGGTEGTLPEATIRLIDPANLPTYAEKLADPSVDGSLGFPAPNATLVTLEDGWQEAP